MLGGERVHSHLFQYSAHTGHVMLEFLRVSLDKRWRNPTLSKLKKSKKLSHVKKWNASSENFKKKNYLIFVKNENCITLVE